MLDHFRCLHILGLRLWSHYAYQTPRIHLINLTHTCLIQWRLTVTEEGVLVKERCNAWNKFVAGQFNQSINQFYFLLSATSSMPLALYNGTQTLVWTHTYTYTVKYSTHTSIHTRQPFRRRYNVFILGTHTLTLVDVASGPRLLYSWQSISSSEESTRRATLDVPASTAPLTTYINSAARGTAFSPGRNEPQSSAWQASRLTIQPQPPPWWKIKVQCQLVLG